jgi:hypothetical protein
LLLEKVVGSPDVRDAESMNDNEGGVPREVDVPACPGDALGRRLLDPHGARRAWHQLPGGVAGATRQNAALSAV